MGKKVKEDLGKVMGGSEYDWDTLYESLKELIKMTFKRNTKSPGT